MEALVDHGQGVDVAVQLGDQPLGAGELGEHLLGEGAVLLNQVVQREEHLLVHAEAADHGRGHAAAQEHVRIVAGVQDQTELFGAALIGNQLEGQIHVGNFLQPLHKRVFFPRGNGRVIGDGDLQRDVAEVLAEPVVREILVVRPLRLPRQRQGKAQQLLQKGRSHLVFLLCHFFYSICSAYWIRISP